jgi:hypothetical protein
MSSPRGRTAGGARERRTLAIGAAAVLGILALGRGVPAWRATLEGRRQGATELHAERVRAERALSTHAALRDTLAARGKRLTAVSATLLPGNQEGAAGRALAAMVSGAATGAEVRLTTTAVLGQDARETGRRAMGEVAGARQGQTPARGRRDRAMLETVAVRAVGTGDIRGIATLLHALEHGPMRLRVRSVAITQPDVAAGDERAESLQIDLVVEGLAVARRDSIRVGGR